MSLRARFSSLKKGLLQRDDVERGLTDELRFHIESRAEALAASGLSHEEALRQARLEFGSADKYKEEVRQARGLRLLDEFRSDLRYAFRVLRKSPAFSLAAILTISIGIAANSSVFSLINEVLYRPLPVGHANELVQFDWLMAPHSKVIAVAGEGHLDPTSGLAATTSFSYLTFERFRDHNRTLSDVFAYNPMFEPINVVADNSAQIAHGEFVSGNYFSALQVTAAMGRTILPLDDVADALPVAVINNRYWKSRFGGESGVVGKTITINGTSFTLIGVSPAGFFGTKIGKEPDIWVPFSTQSKIISSEGEFGRELGSWRWWVEMMGRAKPGMSHAQILADLQPLFETTVRESFDARPQRYRNAAYNERTVIPPLRVNDGSRGPVLMRNHYSQMLTTLFVTVALILLIVCANIANLLLSRASYRQHEIAVRLAIGAGRLRLLRQLLTESLVLALCGGALGILLTLWGRNFLSWFPNSGEEVLSVTPTIDWRVVGFALAISIVTGLLFGVFPGLRATKSDLGPSMRTHSSRGGISKLFVSKSLLSVQVAVCVVLLIGAGLILRSVRNLLTAEIGFNAEKVILFSVDPKLNKYDKTYVQRLYDEIRTAIEARPGIQSVTMSGTRPIMGGGTWFSVMAVDDSMNNEPRAYLHNIGPHFFETMQIPLLLGRTLKPEDATASSKVAVINQALAKRLFKDANPVGKHFKYAEPNMQDHPGFEVVGVVLDARYHRIEEDNPPTMYIPFAEGPTEATFEVRTRIEPSAAVAAIRNTVAGIDRNLPLIEVTTLEDQIRSEIGLYRMFAAFSTVFSVFAVLMASVGLYGVISYTVTRRIHELGIRMALGARPADVIRLVVSGIWLITGAGLVAGIISAVVVTRLIADWLLYGVTFYDPPTIVIAALVITFVSAAAAYVPASRAARLDPMVALRYE